MEDGGIGIDPGRIGWERRAIIDASPSGGTLGPRSWPSAWDGSFFWAEGEPCPGPGKCGGGIPRAWDMRMRRVAGDGCAVAVRRMTVAGCHRWVTDNITDFVINSFWTSAKSEVAGERMTDFVI